MFEKEKAKVLQTAVAIKENRLISLSGGNVSCQVAENRYLVTPSGMLYEQMVPEDICLIDAQCKVIEGRRKPSSDSAALVYMFQNMKNVRACWPHSTAQMPRP